MNRRQFLATTAAPLWSAPPAPPNVIVFLADDLGWADVGYHSSEIRTPNIDRLAAQGVQFGRFYSYPLCSPTRSALMTGRSPMRLGVGYHVIRPWLDYGVPRQEHFMPETFRAAGYQTAICGKWHLGHSRRAFLPNQRGFDHAYGQLNGAIDYFTHERDGGLDWNRNGKSVREQGYSTDLLGAEAERFLTGRDKSRPFFLYLPFNAPHGPLQAPEERIARYSSIANRRRRTYAAMVESMDTAMGRVLDAVRREGQEQNTIVLFFSDNGGTPGEAGKNTPLRGAKGSTWEGGTRVPAVMRWPGRIQPGSTCRQMISVMDVFPTLAGAAGVKPANKLPFDGLNLWPEISTGKRRTRENVLFAVENRDAFLYGLHHREWKLVREMPKDGSAPTDSLFRIEEDPEEKQNLASANPAVVRELAALVEGWRKLYPRDGVRMLNQAPAGFKSPAAWAEAALP